MMRLFAALFALLLLALNAFAQVTPFNHVELKWRTIEGKYHVVHYHVGAERTAREIMQIADKVHEPLVELYHYTPDTKTNWVVYDTDDYSNGATYYLSNRIVIWAPALDFEFRGTHNWLWNVVTHEYAHMIQLGAARKWTRQMPGIYAQVIDYEPESRPDVLYGFPNRIISYPLSSTTVPHWFAEGTAQSMRKGMNYDYRDSHREMLLRTRALAGKLYSLEEMGIFEKNSLGGELVYNQGFSLVQFISNQYGEASLRKLSNAMGTLDNWSFDAACKDALGVSGDQLYNDWVRSLRESYTSLTSGIREHAVAGRLIEESGFANLYPRWSMDGKNIYFISNKDKDFFGGSSLVRYNLDSAKSEKLFKISSPFAIHPKLNGIVFTQQALNHERMLEDLYYHDLTKKKDYRLTYAARVQQPDIAPDGKRVVVITQSDGTMNLLMVTLPDSIHQDQPKKQPLRIDTLTHFANGEQLSRPRFTQSGDSILFSYSLYSNRELRFLSLADLSQSPVRTGRWDDRDAAFSSDGYRYFSSDSTGIFNIYRQSTRNGSIEPVTNVVGGAFFAEPSPDGKRLAFSRYEWDGYKLALLDNIEPVQSSYTQYIRNYAQSLPPVALHTAAPDTYKVSLYQPAFEKTSLLPRLTWDYGRFKPGFYFYTNDFIEKLNMFGAAAVNARGEYDLFLSTDYHNLPPTLFFDFYHLVRKDEKTFDDPMRIIGQNGSGANATPVYAKYDVSYKFKLYEVDIGLRYHLDEETVVSSYAVMSKYDAALNFNDGTPSFGYTYFKGTSFISSLTSTKIARSVLQDIHPTGGYQFGIRAQRANNRFIEGFKVNSEKLTLQEVYIPYNYWQFEGSGNYYWKPLGELTVSPAGKFGYIDQSVDPFFNLYAGGLYGMRGYSFYSLGGLRTAIAQLTVQHPLWKPFGNRQWLGWLHPVALYANTFGDVGSAWRGDVEQAKWRRDWGGELRFHGISWYSFPTAVSLSAARGLDRVTVFENGTVTNYPPQWRFYFTILFGFTMPPSGIQSVAAQKRTLWNDR